MVDSIARSMASDCLGRTCLKWRADGELTALDLSLVMKRLALVDPEVKALQMELPERRPCALIN